ncbi:MAG TPA: hypothetical protein VFE34_22800 [Dongiaceae bacterium]|jgi:hypothetical protein|nr:hypothetical protein [Dongiaceae bacterium]
MSQAVADQVIPEAERLDLERRRLECEKLRVEIAQVSAPWWTRAGYIGSLVPIVIAIVGFGSGLATGFFDTERTALKNEIATLTIKRDQLQAASEGLQKKIDDGYLSLISASAEARYAISHITSLASQHDEIEPKVTSALEKLSGDEERAVSQLLSFSRLSGEIAKITEEELDLVRKSLKEIPASTWVTELRPTIRGQYIPDRVLMEAPDGRLYDPTDGRYYQPGEIGQ